MCGWHWQVKQYCVILLLSRAISERFRDEVNDEALYTSKFFTYFTDAAASTVTGTVTTAVLLCCIHCVMVSGQPFDH